MTGKVLALVQEGIAYQLLTTLEELLEMSGVSLAILALLRNLEDRHPGVGLVLRSAG